MVSFGKKQPLKKQPLDTFARNAAKEFKRLKDTGEPETLTAGKSEAVVLSPAAFRKLSTDAKFAREILALRRSVEQAKRGEGHDYRDVHKELDEIIDHTLSNGRKS